MAITLVNPTAGYIGHGCDISVTTSIATDAAGYGEMQVFDPLLAFVVSTGRVDTDGTMAFDVQLGLSFSGGVSTFGQHQGLPLGNAVTLVVTTHHANGSVIDTGTFAGVFFHEPVSALPDLVFQLTGSNDTLLQQILAAVTTTAATNMP